MVRVPSSDDRRVYAFLRIAPQDTVLVICNFGSIPFQGTLQFSETAIAFERNIFLKDLFAGTSTSTQMTAEKALTVSVPAVGYTLFQLSAGTNK